MITIAIIGLFTLIVSGIWIGRRIAKLNNEEWDDDFKGDLF